MREIKLTIFPCPFCESRETAALDSFQQDLTVIAVDGEFAISCLECGATGPLVADLSCVADSWNFMAAMRSASGKTWKKC